MTRHVDDTRTFKSEQDQLADVERAARRMEGPEGVNLDAIVHGAVASYWQTRERERELLHADPALAWSERFSPTLYRRAAAQLNRWSDYWLDVALPIGAGGLVMLMVFRQSDAQAVLDSLPVIVRSASTQIQLVVVLVAGGICTWLYKHGFLRRSIGAFAGGLAACAVVWQLGVVSASVNEAAAIAVRRALASSELQRTSLALLLRRHQTGEFDTVNMTGDTFRLTTASSSSAHAVYHASTPGLQGYLVADLQPSEGTLRWTDGAEPATRMIYGRVVAVSQNSFSVQDAKGNIVPLNTSKVVMPPLSVGDIAAAAYQSDTRDAIAVVPSSSQDSSTLPKKPGT